MLVHFLCQSCVTMRPPCTRVHCEWVSPFTVDTGIQMGLVITHRIWHRKCTILVYFLCWSCVIIRPTCTNVHCELTSIHVCPRDPITVSTGGGGSGDDSGADIEMAPNGVFSMSNPVYSWDLHVPVSTVSGPPLISFFVWPLYKNMGTNEAPSRQTRRLAILLWVWLLSVHPTKNMATHDCKFLYSHGWPRPHTQWTLVQVGLVIIQDPT